MQQRDADGGSKPLKSSLSDLFHQHNQELIGFLCIRLRSRQEAREVAQEAYARLLRLDQPGTIGFLRAYLFKTAANIAIDRIRHRVTVRAITPMLNPDFESHAETDPEHVAEQDEEARLVADYLDELPKVCKDAFLMYRIQEYSLQEVATRLGVSDRMVRYYIVQAMSHCRQRLDARHRSGGTRS
jgi:RNA polymerase sigma-70 factor (ECF subfamily)